MVYLSAGEVCRFAALSFQDLGYETEAEFEAYVNTLIRLAEGLIERFCHVPHGFFEEGGKSISNTLFDFRSDRIQLKPKLVLKVSRDAVDTSGYGSSECWIEVAEGREYVVALEICSLLKVLYHSTYRWVLQFMLALGQGQHVTVF